jgi:hypothetical protein
MSGFYTLAVFIYLLPQHPVGICAAGQKKAAKNKYFL